MISIPVSPIRSFLSVGLALLLVVASGCTGSRPSYSVDVGSLADSHLPRTRNTEVHPDSVRRLAITEEETGVRFELQESYEHVHRLWSSTFQFRSADREARRPLTYATLWSKELSLAALQADEAVMSLPKEEALRRIDEREREYEETIQIDVYWFSGPDGSSITGPGAQVELRDREGNRYRPAEEDDSPLREAFLLGGSTALYRRNIFYFDRMVDGRDLLAETDELTLRVAPTGGPPVEFGWSWASR